MRPVVGATWGLAFLAMAGVARAQPLPGDKAVEQGKQGLELYNQSRFTEAYDRLAAAESLSHSPVFLLYMARAKRHAGDWLGAEALFQKVASESLSSESPAAWARAVADASSEGAEVSRAMPTITVTLRGAERAQYFIDGQPAAVQGNVLRTNPGKRTVEARDGDRRASEEITAREGRRTEVTLTLALSGPTKAPRDTTPDVERGPLALGIALLATGGAALLAGAVTGGVAFAIKDDIGSRCDGNDCLASDAEEGATMGRLATASTVCFIAGGALAATGLVLVIVRPGGAPAPKVSLAPGLLTASWQF